MWSKFANVTPALEISQNSQENTSVRISFLIKLQARPETLLKKRLRNRCEFFDICIEHLLQNTASGCFSSHFVIKFSAVDKVISRH